MHGFEDFGRSFAENGTATEGTLYRHGTEDRQNAAAQASREAETRLFEDIGRYFHISAQNEQMETQNAPSSVEVFAESFNNAPIEGERLAALATENVCTYTAEGGFQFKSDTEGFKPQRPYINGHLRSC